MSGIDSFSRVPGIGGTAAARALDKSKESPSQDDQSRRARVEALREQYQRGEYVVDTVQLSAALVETMLKRS